MAGLANLLLGYVWSSFQSRERLKAEIVILRHQLNILSRRAPKRPRMTGIDRALFVWFCRLFPNVADAVSIIRPETIIRWHRAGFRMWWRWKSHNLGGRPKVDRELRDLVRRMCEENRLWGAPRVHGELLKLGFTVAQSTVSKYMLRGRRPPLQSWETFLRNHMDGIAAADLRRILQRYVSYYNATRTHLGLGKDSPESRPIESHGRIVVHDVLGGLHHQYCRM